MFRSLVLLGFLFLSFSSQGQGDRVSYFNKYNENKLFEVKAKQVSVDKFFDQEALKQWAERFSARPGDLIFLLAGEQSLTLKALGELRLAILETFLF